LLRLRSAGRGIADDRPVRAIVQFCGYSNFNSMRRLKTMPAHKARDTNSTQRSGTNSGVLAVVSGCVGMAAYETKSNEARVPTITASETIKP
jgi:hypothetical protein